VASNDERESFLLEEEKGAVGERAFCVTLSHYQRLRAENSALQFQKIFSFYEIYVT
jgi:hypothetical protein